MKSNREGIGSYQGICAVKKIYFVGNNFTFTSQIDDFKEFGENN